MLFTLIILLIIFLGFWIIFSKKNINEIIDDVKNVNKETRNEMGELFFKEVKSGAKKKKLSNISKESDFVRLKTLFDEKKIPYYIETNYVLNFLLLRRFEKYVAIYILEKNYDEIIKIIEENKN